jgi:hypothetical protein
MRIAPLLPLAFTLSACNDKADPAADTDLTIDADADADADADNCTILPADNPSNTDISAADVHPNSGAYSALAIARSEPPIKHTRLVTLDRGHDDRVGSGRDDPRRRPASPHLMRWTAPTPGI